MIADRKPLVPRRAHHPQGSSQERPLMHLLRLTGEVSGWAASPGRSRPQGSDIPIGIHFGPFLRARVGNFHLCRSASFVGDSVRGIFKGNTDASLPEIPRGCRGRSTDRSQNPRPPAFSTSFPCLLNLAGQGEMRGGLPARLRGVCWGGEECGRERGADARRTARRPETLPPWNAHGRPP